MISPSTVQLYSGIFRTLRNAFIYRNLVDTPGIHAFFISNPFISNARMRLANNQANAKQHPEVEHLLLFENYSYSSSTLSSKLKYVSVLMRSYG